MNSPKMSQVAQVFSFLYHGNILKSFELAGVAGVARVFEVNHPSIYCKTFRKGKHIWISIFFIIIYLPSTSMTPMTVIVISTTYSGTVNIC